MLIVQVTIQVKPEYVDAFIAESKDNAQASLLEPGVLRFDILQEQQEPSRFEFLEIYRTEEDSLKHRETDHFHRWQENCVPLMLHPRSRIKFTNVYPPDEEWVDNMKITP